ncbi:N-acetylmuramoyl-L-alanine amidase [Streptomyces sp. NPDC018057]|uniref:N-acetylmuramoyl-L-alanine amidase n=1 Tax=unclassified Streptomyces TaxID=2593676 RepID=UPI0037B51ACC
MSYSEPGPQSPHPDRPEPPGRPGRSRRTPVVLLTALVCGGLLGWLGYEAVGAPDDGSAASPPASAASASPAAPGAPSGSPGPSSEDGKGSGAGTLAGKVVVIDPGHNPGNFRHTSQINRPVDIGTGRKECDTTGTSTNDGYAEARFTLDVAHRLRTLLQRQGVTVKLTHDDGSPDWGPCVDERARIGNSAHADAALSIHADGAAPGDRGFHVILPAAVHGGAADTRPIAAASRVLGEHVADGFRRSTGEPPSDYLGGGTGLVTRKDLGGLNLSTVPKVFIECGNMRNRTDAALLTSGSWRQKAAEGLSEGIVSFLRGS